MGGGHQYKIANYFAANSFPLLLLTFQEIAFLRLLAGKDEDKLGNTNLLHLIFFGQSLQDQDFSLTHLYNADFQSDLIAMVVSILVEVTMFMVVVMMVVAVSSVAKVSITTKPPSETSTETPGQGRSLLKPMRLHVRSEAVHLKVILKVVKVLLILWVDLALVVETRHDHHQKRQNLSSREIGFFSKVYTLYNILVRIEDATNNNLETA